MIAARFILIPIHVLIVAACARAAADRAPLAGSSSTLTVRGEYAAVAVDGVDGISVRDGRLVVRGPSSTVSVDLPPVADPTQLNRGWALVTEGVAGDKRSLTFTHETTLDDFSIELPGSDAQMRYGSMAGRGGEDVLVFAWGDHTPSYWGYVTIVRKR